MEKRFVDVKAGKFLRWLIEYYKQDKKFAKLSSKGSLDAFIEEFSTMYKSQHKQLNFFVSERGDLDRLVYAYYPWGDGSGTISNSCLRGGKAIANKDLKADLTQSADYYYIRDAEGENIRLPLPYCSALSDSVLSVDHFRTVMLTDDIGAVKARALLRDTYLDGELLGLTLDRTYYDKEQQGYQLIERVKEQFANELVFIRNTGTRNSMPEHMGSWGKVADGIRSDDRLGLYTPVLVNKHNVRMTFQDTFQYHNRILERGYMYQGTYKGRSLRKNQYNVHWDQSCNECGKAIPQWDDGIPLDDNGQIYLQGHLFCSMECATKYGFVKCECPECQKQGLYHKDNGITLPNGMTVCSYECAAKMGYKRCDICGKWVANDFVWAHDFRGMKVCSDNCLGRAGYFKCSNPNCPNDEGYHSTRERGVIKLVEGDNTFWFCDSTCAKASGWNKCSKCGEWHPSNAPKIKIGRKSFCSERCAKINGFYKCERCGKYHDVKTILCAYDVRGYRHYVCADNEKCLSTIEYVGFYRTDDPSICEGWGAYFITLGRSEE